MKETLKIQDNLLQVLTIYSVGYATVRETRRLERKSGEREIIYDGVTELIEVETLQVKGGILSEFSYEFDFGDDDDLLSRYLGKEIIIGGKSYKVICIENHSRLVLEAMKTGDIMFKDRCELVLPKGDAELLLSPRLDMRFQKVVGDEIEIAYISGGLEWDANYVFEIREDKLDLTGWAKVLNETGKSFKDAVIRLVAGELNKKHNYRSGYGRYGGYDVNYNANMNVMGGVPEGPERGISEYHLYELEGRRNLQAKKSRTFRFLDKKDIPCSLHYVLDLYNRNVSSILELEGQEALALPEGKVKVYQEDKVSKDMEFVGEDTIENSGEEKNLLLNMGKAFDIEFQFLQTENRKSEDWRYRRFEIIINNRKNKAAEVRSEYVVPEEDWEMVDSTHDYNLTFDSIEYRLMVPAKAEIKVTFEYRSEIED